MIISTSATNTVTRQPHTRHSTVLTRQRLWGGVKEGQGRRGYSVLTSLSFQRPGMQKDSSRSLPHRSKMRNSEGRGQAGRERRTFSKPSHVYCTQTNRKESEDTMAVRSRPQATHQSPRTSLLCPGWHFHLAGRQTAQNSSATQYCHMITVLFRVLPTKVKRSM